MSCVAIDSRKSGFSYTLVYNMLNFSASTHCATFQQKKPFPEVLFVWEIGS